LKVHATIPGFMAHGTGYGPHYQGLLPEFAAGVFSGMEQSMADPDLNDVLMIVDQRLKLLGLSDREASIRATGKPDAIREMRRGKWPSDRRLRQIAGVLEVSLEHLLNSGPDYRGQYLQALPPAEFARSEGVQGLPRDIAVYGPTSFSPSSANAQHKISIRQPLRFACRPPILANRSDAFCIMMPDLSMRPRFDVGDELYVDPRRLPAPGDYVVLRLVDEGQPESADWTVIVRLLVDFNEEAITVQAHNPQKSTSFGTDAVWMMFRVIPWGELLSY